MRFFAVSETYRKGNLVNHTLDLVGSETEEAAVAKCRLKHLSENQGYALMSTLISEVEEI